MSTCNHTDADYHRLYNLNEELLKILKGFSSLSEGHSQLELMANVYLGYKRMADDAIAKAEWKE